jgi:MoxR-like ATPase
MSSDSPTVGEESGILRRRESELLRALLWEIKKVVVGNDQQLESVVVCLIAGGHCLLEGLPGVAKTMTVQTLARVVGAQFTRIQFTPDLVPSDITGTRIYRTSSERFDFEPGPLFTNLLLADEINRAPAKVQSALLEVMAERQVTVAGRTHELPRPFLVLATENPIETEGVYPLPEAQRDRFLMKVLVGYPELNDEVEIARRMNNGVPAVRQILTLERLVALQDSATRGYVDPSLLTYVAKLVVATRQPADYGLRELAPYIACGASPRATLGLIAAAKALALIHGRGYVLSDDIQRLAHAVLRHRLVLTYEALADGVTADVIIDGVLDAVRPPRRSAAHQMSARS